MCKEVEQECFCADRSTNWIEVWSNRHTGASPNRYMGIIWTLLPQILTNCVIGFLLSSM